MVLGLSIGFIDPFPNPPPQENVPLGCPHALRDSWQLPDYRLIGGWQQLWGWLVNPLVTRPIPKRPSPTTSGLKSKDPKLKSLQTEDRTKEAAAFLCTSRQHPWSWGWILTFIQASRRAVGPHPNSPQVAVPPSNPVLWPWVWHCQSHPGPQALPVFSGSGYWEPTPQGWVVQRR